MSLIQFTNLSFTYDGSRDPVFDRASFQIDTNWKLGLVGRNGRGKTTLLRLLLGQYAYQGTIAAFGVHFEYFPFAVPDDSLPAASVVEAVSPGAQPWQIKREFSRLSVGEDALTRPFRALSHGERTKALLAALFLKESRFLLIDEPTNHLDAEARRAVSSYLDSKKGYILVSHDRAFLDGCVDHILSINKADIELQTGNFSSWLRNKRLRDEFELAENEKLKKEIGRLSAAASRTARWANRAEAAKIGIRPGVDEKNIDARAYKGEKARRMQSRRKNLESRRQSAAEEKTKLLKNIESAEPLNISPLAYRSDRLIELSRVAIRYGEKIVCDGVTLCARQGDRIALQGKNGCGKSSILNLIAGECLTFSGDLRKNTDLIVSYVPQSASFLRGALSDYAKRSGIDETLFKTILRKFDFSRAQFDQPMEAFSEGQKKKVLLAQSLSERAHLYLWDEPLNFIDVFSRMQIEELLLKCAPTLIFVEHDKAFAEKIATRIVRL